ncbi:MAG: hypothetical protein QME79_04155 [Bacillota bacterium]|nr:hypothetical protein [Bacillota bacterium]
MRGGRWVASSVVTGFLVVLVGFFVWPPPATAARSELIELRTSHSKTFKNDDGAMTLELSGRPLHYQDDPGRVLPVPSEKVGIFSVGLGL